MAGLEYCEYTRIFIIGCINRGEMKIISIKYGGRFIKVKDEGFC